MEAAQYTVQLLLKFLKEDQVFAEPEVIDKLSLSTLPEQRTPQIVVYPQSVPDVQKIVDCANSLKIPLWYVSTGKNWGYGCRAASYHGGITIILERMKKIIEVNEQLGYAVIEPGVTYEDLHNYLEEKGINLWTDAAGTTKSASIIGNALDKGRGLTPYADHFGMLCGMSVVLANGKLLDSSLSSNFLCQHTYKWGVGPYIEGLFAQSNLGIVVKAGIWLMPKPEKYCFFAFEYNVAKEKFASFIDDFRQLCFSGGMLSRPHLANDFAMLCILDQYPKGALQKGEKFLSVQALESWKQQHGVKDWSFGGGLYGTSSQIKAQKKLVKKYLSAYGKLRFVSGSSKTSWLKKTYQKALLFLAKFEGKSENFVRQIYPAMGLFRGQPTDEFVKQVYFKSEGPRPHGQFTPALDKCGFVWTGPLLPFTSGHVEEVLKTAKGIYQKYEFDFFVELIVESPRNLIALFGVFFDLNCREEAARAQKWYNEIRATMNTKGYAPYRETNLSTNRALEFNPNLKNFLAKIKGVIDPQNTFAPGKYGL